MCAGPVRNPVVLATRRTVSSRGMHDAGFPRCGRTAWNSSRHTGTAWSSTTRCVDHFAMRCTALKPYVFLVQEYNYCRKPERALNQCMFEKLVSSNVGGPPGPCLSYSHPRALSKPFLDLPRARPPSMRSRTQYIVACRSRRSNTVAAIYETIPLLVI